MRGRGIAGVARQPVLPVRFRQLRSHMLLLLHLRINYRLRAKSLCSGSIQPLLAGAAQVRRSSFVTFRTTAATTDWEGSATSLKPRLAGGTPAAQPPDLGSRMKSVM